jgi:hypothetical protein
VAALNSFVFLKKYITNHNQKCEGCTFKDFMLACVEKIKPQDKEG